MALVDGELGEDWDAEHLGGKLFGDRHAVEAAIFLIHEALLAMERDRVVDLAANLASGEEGLERVATATWDTERELVPDTLAGEVDRQQNLRGLIGARAILGDTRTAFEGGVVEDGVAGAGTVEGRQVGQLDVQQGSL